MKNKILSFKIEQPKHRAHRVLFCDNTPFTPKVTKNKTLYNRKSKHKGKQNEY